MTTLADPYPPHIGHDEPDENYDESLAIVPTQDAVANRLIATLARLAQAVEQNTLALLDRPTAPAGPQVASTPTLAALPPVQGIQQAAQTNGVCPIHNVPWKVVPAGVSKKSGNAYEAFRACSVSGCDQRPPR